jgi:hypothetical protein
MQARQAAVAAWTIIRSCTHGLRHKQATSTATTRSPPDAAIALQLAATGGWDPAADVNGDRRIISLDALMILHAAAGRIEL